MGVRVLKLAEAQFGAQSDELRESLQLIYLCLYSTGQYARCYHYNYEYRRISALQGH